MKRAGGHEQDVVGLDVAELGLHRGAFDDRQQVALHALARDIRAARVAGHHLVDFIDEHDAQVFGKFDRLGVDLLLVDQGVALLFEQNAAGLGHGHFATDGLLGK
jgi:hypothetical protein